MIRSIKALGLAFLAIAAVGALTASAAQGAAAIHITTEKDKAVITGQGEKEVLKIGKESEVQCETATFEGTVDQAIHATQLTASEIEVTPTFAGCQAKIGSSQFATTVQMNGCKFMIKGTADLTALAAVTGCTPEKAITINIGSGTCIITIGNQINDFPHIIFTNDAKGETTEHHLQDHVTISGFEYTRDGAECPQGEASYSGTTTIKAYEDAGTVQVTKHKHQYAESIDGSEVGIRGGQSADITFQNDKAVITGAGVKEVLTIGATTIQCEAATFEGTVTQASPAPQLTASEIIITPTYQECTGFGGISVTVQMNACSFQPKGTAELTAQTQVTGCTESKKITIKSLVCTITIGEQGELSHITFTNDAGQAQELHHLQDHVTISGFTYTRDGFFCPQGESSYSGTTTIKAYEDEGTVQVTRHGHQYDEVLDGGELGIHGEASEAHITFGDEVHITTGKDKAVITGHGEDEVVKIGTTTVQCETATLEGTVSQATHETQLTASELEVTPTYQGCQGFGGIKVSVQAHGCKFTIVGTAELTAEGGVTGCTPGKSLTIKSQVCTLTIGNQEQDFPHITLTNDSEQAKEKHHLQAHMTVSGFKYTRDGFFCPQGEASYSGTTTIKAYEDAGTEVVTLHEHQYNGHLCGKEVGILAT